MVLEEVDTAAPGGITSVRLQNFKAHRDTMVPLGRLTVLVGPNGSGKTSVLEALRALAAYIGTPGPMLMGDQTPADVRHRGSSEPSTLTAQGASQGKSWTVVLKFDDPRPSLTATYGKEDVTEEPRRVPYGTTVLHQFDAAKIAAGAVPEVSLSPVAPDGANTAAVLSSLKVGDDDRFERIQVALRRIVPTVEKIRVRRERAPGSVREKIHFDLRGAPDLPAQVVSEGTLVALAVLTSICAAPGLQLVLLDDIDHALHPAAQLELVRQMKQLLEEMPEVQIVATTHSAFILDELDPADVCVFALRADGSVAMKRLSEHPDAGKAKGALSGGQIWTLDPEEKWVVAESA
jgi:predicted ATPase